jgi:hypothetical protein
MTRYHEYWSFAAVRGVLALLAAAVVVALPRAIADLFSIPVLLAFSISAFALWAVFDSATTILLANLFPSHATGRKTLLPQAVIVFVIATLLFLTGYRVLPASTLVWLVAAQAAFSALTEFRIARTTHQTYECLSCYTTAITFAVAALAVPFAADLSASDMTLALGAYLALIGSSEFALSGRMLFLEYRKDNPAPQFLSTDWRTAMEPATQPAIATFASTACTPNLTCETCPAIATCLDDSIASQFTSIVNSRESAIVRSLRANALLTRDQAHAI